MTLRRSQTLPPDNSLPYIHRRRTVSTPSILSSQLQTTPSPPSRDHYWDYEYRAFRDIRVGSIRTTTIIVDFPYVTISVQKPYFSQRVDFVDFHPFTVNHERFWNDHAQHFIPRVTEQVTAVRNGSVPLSPCYCSRVTTSTTESLNDETDREDMAEVLDEEVALDAHSNAYTETKLGLRRVVTAALKWHVSQIRQKIASVREKRRSRTRNRRRG